MKYKWLRNIFKCSTCVAFKEMQIKILCFLLIPVNIDKIKTKWWHILVKIWERGTTHYFWSVWELVQLLRELVCMLLNKIERNIPHDLSITLLDIIMTYFLPFNKNETLPLWQVDGSRDHCLKQNMSHIGWKVLHVLIYIENIKIFTTK